MQNFLKAAEDFRGLSGDNRKLAVLLAIIAILSGLFLWAALP